MYVDNFRRASSMLRFLSSPGKTGDPPVGGNYMAGGRASRRVVRGVAGTATLGLLATGLGLGIGAGTASAAPGDRPVKSDVRDVGGDYNNGKPPPFSKEGAGGNGIKSDEFKV